MLWLFPTTLCMDGLRGTNLFISEHWKDLNRIENASILSSPLFTLLCNLSWVNEDLSPFPTTHFLDLLLSIPSRCFSLSSYLHSNQITILSSLPVFNVAINNMDTLIVSLLYTRIVFILPWNKQHYCKQVLLKIVICTRQEIKCVDEIFV